MASEFVQLSLSPMLIGTFAALACALPGNFLLLRRQALVGDAISHVVLPGIVLSFLITGAVTTSAMLIGAGVAALVAVLMIEMIRRHGRVEPGAAMGITFTTLFALGVLMLERSDTSGVHLDVEHALYGNIESLVWLAARDWGSLIDPEALAALPPALPRMAAISAFIVLSLAICWRPLVLSTFDEVYAETRGVPVRLLGIGLTMVAAMAAVAAFEAVGSIIAIAMFICPPAAARLMTDSLLRQIGWSALFATLSANLGYIVAGYGPGWFGLPNAVSAAGMIATLSGIILAACCLWAPRRRGNNQALA